MSGEVVYLRGVAGGDVEALVRAAKLVVDHAGVPTAIIGGLAVTCRLASAHRATGDVDLVADEPEVVAGGRSAVESLVDAGIASRHAGDAPGRLHVQGTKVEIIETGHVDPAEMATVEPEMARLFVLSHRWALDTASRCTIAVVGSDVTAEVPVATAAALVAMKLHAIEDRNEDRKRASDAWDLYQLLGTHLWTGAFRDAFEVAPDGLRRLVGEAIERVFRSEVTRTRRWLRVYGEPAWAAQATEDSLTALADEVARALP